mmetsp:Transcript_7058/g.11508  ORF Transcript_7058/g.11508 Transcript_7058/m.11508 type:complete len:227 (+) Transcript_7058:197-877(+)
MTEAASGFRLLCESLIRNRRLAASCFNCKNALPSVDRRPPHLPSAASTSSKASFLLRQDFLSPVSFIRSRQSLFRADMRSVVGNANIDDAFPPLPGPPLGPFDEDMVMHLNLLSVWLAFGSCALSLKTFSTIEEILELTSLDFTNDSNTGPSCVYISPNTSPAAFLTFMLLLSHSFKIQIRTSFTPCESVAKPKFALNDLIQTSRASCTKGDFTPSTVFVATCRTR